MAALFGSQKKKETTEKTSKDVKENAQKEANKPVVQTHSTIPEFKQGVLLGPRITEKATNLAADHNVAVFNVRDDATKVSVREAVEAMYNVTPKKVRLAKIARKNIMRRGEPGVKGGGKKAYVYLKKGDSINLF